MSGLSLLKCANRKLFPGGKYCVLFAAICLPLIFHSTCFAQDNCVFQPPAIKIDFGSRDRDFELNTSLIEYYNLVNNDCPQDGNYAIVPATKDCFYGHWYTVNQDHTSGDIEGNMLLVNSSYTPGLFYARTLTGLLPNTTYEFGAWVLNVCWAANNCDPLRPNIRFIITTLAGKELAKFSTGELPPSGSAAWIQYTALFKTPPNTGTLLLKVETKGPGGCGNDFAMDDITIRECKPRSQVSKERPIPVSRPVDKKLPPVVKKDKPAQEKLPVKKETPVFTKVPVRDTLITNRPVAKNKATIIPVPPLLLSRLNPVVRQIETASGELTIDLYDNGEIDGDMVSIYHNNKLVVSRAALSAKPVSLRITIDASQPHHELVMVANNLGSIPPNTSLMILTARKKRHEVFISSSEQKNAKIVIDLKE